MLAAGAIGVRAVPAFRFRRPASRYPGIRLPAHQFPAPDLVPQSIDLSGGGFAIAVAVLRKRREIRPIAQGVADALRSPVRISEDVVRDDEDDEPAGPFK